MLKRAGEKPRWLSEPHCLLGRYSPQIHQVSFSWGDWIGWIPASWAENTEKSNPLINNWHCMLLQQKHVNSCFALTFTLAVVVRGTWPVALPYSRFSCVAWCPTRAAKAVARWRRSKVFCGGIFNSSAKVSELKRGSSIYGRAYWQKKTTTNVVIQSCHECMWKTCRKAQNLLTISPPCTPLPRRLGAYSARSTALSHSITRWFDHCTTSEGEGFFCQSQKQKVLIFYLIHTSLIHVLNTL